MQRHFSLVLATLGRYREVESFLQSLEKQTYRFFSVVLVDQNPDASFLGPLIAHYGTSFEILRVVSPKGLSKARNTGLLYCRGDIVCFPDDDCIYPPDLLACVNAAFDTTGADVLVGRQLDMRDNDSTVSPPQIRRFLMCLLRRGRTEETVESLCWNAPSSVLFFSKTAVARTGNFDEHMGVGADTPWGSGEETDYLLRAVLNGCTAVRRIDLCVHHPSIDFSRVPLEKARAYGRGRSFLIRKHRLGLIFALMNILFPLAKAVYRLPDIATSRYYLHLAWGRMEVFLQK